MGAGRPAVLRAGHGRRARHYREQRGRRRAADAAREASLARTADEAYPRAKAAAQSAFDDSKLHCASTSVTVDTSGFSAPLGQYGAVTARVRCTVALADLGAGFGSKTVESSFTSVIDRYRQR